MTVLVAMTYHDVPPDMLERAVESVLAQTQRDLRLVVYGDGQAPPIDVSDERVTVHVAEHNRGTYFGHEVMLRASPYDWYAPVDADDWVEPDHLEQLLALDAPSVVTGVLWFHHVEGRTRVTSGKETWWVGLHRTGVLRDIGGFAPHERIGQDGLTQVLLRIHGGRATYRGKPTYHRVKRHGSLTMKRETRIGSSARREVRRRNAATSHVVKALAPDWGAVRAYRQAEIPPSLRTALDVESARLRAALPQAVAV